MMVFTVNRAKLIEIMNKTFGSCKYKLGAKPKVIYPPEKIKYSDCSGYVRYVLYHTVEPAIILPSGSWYQEQWAIANLTPCQYSDASKLDSIVRIAFIGKAARQNKPGHVWLIVNGRTVECYGGVGAGRREWDIPVLVERKPRCYIIGKLV